MKIRVGVDFTLIWLYLAFEMLNNIECLYVSGNFWWFLLGDFVVPMLYPLKIKGAYISVNALFSL